MSSTPHPHTEAARLEAVRNLGILDTPRELEFDALAAQAARALDMPIVAITLIDDQRVWFRGRAGTALQEVGRHVSFCSFAILTPGPLLVEDTTQDVRFQAMANVVGQTILRSYAGIPLLLDGVLPIGTVCGMDRVPRRLSDYQVGVLRAVAKAAMARIAVQQMVRGISLDCADDRRDVLRSGYGVERPSSTAWQATSTSPEPRLAGLLHPAAGVGQRAARVERAARRRRDRARDLACRQAFVIARPSRDRGSRRAACACTDAAARGTPLRPAHSRRSGRDTSRRAGRTCAARPRGYG